MADAKQNKASERQRSLLITSLNDWVCSNVRPISIVEDSGLRNVIDQCIQIGRACECSTYFYYISFIIYNYGPTPASSLLH